MIQQRRQQFATAAMFLWSLGAPAINRRDGQRHSLHPSAQYRKYNEDLIFSTLRQKSMRLFFLKYWNKWAKKLTWQTLICNLGTSYRGSVDASLLSPGLWHHFGFVWNVKNGIKVNFKL